MCSNICHRTRGTTRKARTINEYFSHSHSIDFPPLSQKLFQFFDSLLISFQFPWLFIFVSFLTISIDTCLGSALRSTADILGLRCVLYPLQSRYLLFFCFFFDICFYYLCISIFKSLDSAGISYFLSIR